MANGLFQFQNWIGDVPKNLRFDVIAGLTLWGMAVPEAIAYTGLAGVPPQAGLYLIMIGLPIYVLFCSSPNLVATPTSAVSATLGGTLVTLQTSDPLTGLAAMTICTGVIFLLMAKFKLGRVIDFISEPVNRGFIFGLAVFVIISQLGKVMGISGASGNVAERIAYYAANFDQFNLPVFLMAMAALASLLILPKLSKKIPAGLLVMAILIFCFWKFDLAAQYNADMVGALPSSLPTLILPVLPLADFAIIIPASLGVVLVALSEATAVAEDSAPKGTRVDANRQLTAFGFENVGSGFFGGLVGSGSMSATSVNDGAGAKSPFSLIVLSFATLLTVLFLADLFVFLPELYLGALIIHAVLHHLILEPMKELRRVNKADFWVSIVAAAGVIAFDVLPGLLMAVALHVFIYLAKTTKIQIQEMGASKDFQALLLPLSDERAKKPAENTVIIGTEMGRLFYATAKQYRDQILDLIANRPKVDTVIIDGTAARDVGFTSLENIDGLIEALHDAGVKKIELFGVRSEAISERWLNLSKKYDYISMDDSLNSAYPK